MKARLLKFVLATATVSVLAGCAAPIPIKTYEGQQLPVEDVSVLMVDRQTTIYSIAGYKPDIKLTGNDISMKGTEFEVQPGPQQVVFSLSSTTSSSDNVGVPPKGTIVTTTYRSVFTLKPIKIFHDFKKGHKYELHYRHDEKKYHALIVDVTDGGAKRDYGVAWGNIRP
ncbi:hypothetical protein [Noviherbaspirillum soli]|uniref:hypothetical protein n=1 Tax=Noviherbaspirillum soli TaxID=1064518 RepID=UPI00188A6D77|nr:hypothetical protein [Noviherbaspirillum soli]